MHTDVSDVFRRFPFIPIFLLVASSPVHASQDAWPPLPDADGAVEIRVQEWPQRPGARNVRVLVHYPGGKRANVTKDTGIMLTLHNWGGVDCVGTANPKELANRLNVIALCVNYLQSGPKDSIEGPEPYDFGYLQALDSLRALYFVFHDMRAKGQPFAAGRVYCTGGSGGGNVTLMANKLAPRTFACVIDLCGMAKLSDDIAFNLPGGSSLDARWSRDPKSPNYLSLDHQEMRYVGNPDHLATMKQLGATGKIVVVHGIHDTTCPFADAQEMAFWMRHAGLDIVPRQVTPKDTDGKIFTSTGHALGDRTKIVFEVAGKYLMPGGKETLVRKGPTDFERKEPVVYRTSNGQFVIDYAMGYPVGRFESRSELPPYPDHTDLRTYRDTAGKDHPIKTKADWAIRRQHVVEGLERVTGPLPSPLRRVPLNIKVVGEQKVGDLVRRQITYQSDPDDRVPAYVFLPPGSGKRPAVLCLHQTTPSGKDEPAGVKGHPDLKYALELAERGYICIVPDYPSFGEHKFDFAAKPAYASGSMKAIWDNIRAVDVLETLLDVDTGRIGVIGHSLGGHNAMFTAVFEPRLKAIVSSCGFTTFRKDDMPSWTGPRYMPRIKSQFGSDARKVPFDFQEIVASFAPRAFLACAAEKDDDFDVSGVRDVMAAAAPVYKLFGATDRLSAHYPPGKHAFPPEARKTAYEFLDRQLKK